MPPNISSPLSFLPPAVVAVVLVCAPPARAATLEVPSQYSTIQAAFNAAANGDLILLAPGVYKQRPTLAGKAVTIASRFYTTGDRAYIDETIIDGSGGSYVVLVQHGNAAPTLVGLTVRNGGDGIRAFGKFRFLDGRITLTDDGIDYESGSGGFVANSVFEGNSDDGIDSDNDVNVIIANNAIRNNGDDGIEIRLQAWAGPPLSLVIRDNTISGNGEDGIQIISYNVLTPRSILIERNLFLNNAMAGVGMMCCENTVENYNGAALGERVGIYHNTFFGNDHGVTGGDSVAVVNNLFVHTTNVALKRVGAGSIAAHNLFFGNGTDHVQSNVDLSTTLFADPQLRPDHSLWETSPAIDAGTPLVALNGRVWWKRDASEYWGNAPDLGAVESHAVLAVENGVTRGGVELLPPAPNPAHGVTRLRLDVPAAQRVRLEILDIAGRQVRLLQDDVVAGGRHEVPWDGLDAGGTPAPAGVYFARATTDRVRTCRFVRLD